MAQADYPHSTAMTLRPVLHMLRGGRPSLADDCALFRADTLGHDDPDYEGFTWPETFDQTHIADPAWGRFTHDDAEIDDGV